MASKTKQAEMSQAEVFAGIVYAAYQTYFKVVLRSKINPGEDVDVAAERHWNENLPGIALCWDGLVKGMLMNFAGAQAAGALPAMVQTVPPPLPGLTGTVPGQDPVTLPGALASRLAGQMRARQDAARAASPLPEAYPATAALDVPSGLAIGRETEAPAPAPEPPVDPGYSGGGGDTGGGGASGDY